MTLTATVRVASLWPMRFMEDLFAKVLLQEALDVVSEVELQKLVVPSDSQYSDVYCEPRPQRPPKQEVPYLGVLWEMTQTICTFEPFSQTPTVTNLRALARKQLALHHQLCHAADNDALPMPPQWILSPGVPHRALQALGAVRATDWPTGFYRSGELLGQWIVVLPELVAEGSPETRVLRLLGPPKQRLATMEELEQLPSSDPTRQPLLEILSELIYLTRVKLKSAEPLSEPESANMTELRREFEAFKASLRLEGRVEGEREGETKGRVEGKSEALLAVLTARGVVVPEAVRQKILACRDLATLDRLLVQAATATSPDDVLIAAA
jgi:hypothetical protein